MSTTGMTLCSVAGIEARGQNVGYGLSMNSANEASKTTGGTSANEKVGTAAIWVKGLDLTSHEPFCYHGDVIQGC